MPRRSLDPHFENERPEWTERKHELLERTVIPSVEKMKLLGQLALVDGYAGPNEYGGAVQGSTVIMVNATKRLRLKGHQATVFACEPNQKRYQQLVRNLSNAVDSEILVVYNECHTDARPRILQLIGGSPAFVFLDPHGPKDLRLQEDLLPWLRRPKTDVLGIFMGGDGPALGGSLHGTRRV